MRGPFSLLREERGRYHLPIDLQLEVLLPFRNSLFVARAAPLALKAVRRGKKHKEEVIVLHCHRDRKEPGKASGLR